MADEYYATSDLLDAVRVTKQMVLSALSRLSCNVVTQADEAAVHVGEVTHMDTTENFTIAEPEEEASFDSGMSIALSKETRLGMYEIMERPILLSTYDLELDTNVDVSFSPWNLILSNPVIASRYRNHAFIRFDMELTISVSCSQFHYGTLVFSYYPLPDSNRVAKAHVAGALPRYQTLMHMSQLEGTSVLRLHDNKPVSMHIPFIHYRPMIRLFNQSTSASTIDFPAASDMGTILIKTLNQLRSTNASAPTQVSINVYGKMKNISISGVTGTRLVITEANDERITGPVEKMSSALADASGMLSVIPLIAPYAMASSVIFRAISKVSAIFGFSVPAISPADHLPHHMRGDAFQNNVTAESVFMGKKISLDHKQELTVDPRIACVAQDEMSLSFLNERESLLTTFTVDEKDEPMSTVLFSCAVTPQLGNVSGGTPAICQNTPMSFAAQNFFAWRGDIIFKLQVNKSQFHKQKLAVFFEPNMMQSTLINSNLSLNRQLLVVFDISETDTVEFCLPFVSDSYYKRCYVTSQMRTLLETCFQNGSFDYQYHDPYAIGYIAVYPFTKLQSPDSTKPIEVNVYVKSKNMRYNGYVDRVERPLIVTESNDVSLESNTCFELSQYNTDSNVRNKYHFGEQPISFRQYLKRYWTSATVPAGAVGLYRFIIPIVPDVGPDSLASELVPFSLFDYLRFAFLGMRGGFRKRIRMIGHNFDATDRVSVELLPPSDTYPIPDVSSSNEYSSAIGTAMFVPRTNAGVEIELPFYDNNLFIPSGLSHAEINEGMSYPFTDNGFHGYHVKVDSLTDTINDVYFVEDSSIAEDFTFLRFYGVPYWMV